MSGYSWISIISLSCYLILFVTFLAAKKTQKVMYTFMVFLFALIFWSGGSFAMRIQLWPSVNFWHYVSLAGIFLIPVVFYHFVLDFLEEPRGGGRFFWLVVFLGLIIFNMLTDSLIPRPEVVQEGGGVQFIYHYSWQIYVVFLLVVLCWGQLAFLIRRHCKGNGAVFLQLIPVLCGIGAIFLGNILATLPFFQGFPLDILSGVVNAGLLFYALYKKQLFRMTMLISRPNCFLLSSILGLLISYNYLLPIQNFLVYVIGVEHNHALIIMAMCMLVFIGLLYLFISLLVNALFVRGDQQQGVLIARFSQEVTRLLGTGDILRKLSDITQEALGVYRIFALVRMEGEDYKLLFTSSPLEEKNVSLPPEHPLVQYFRENGGCVLQREFSRTTMYRGMWENEKQLFSSLGIECFCPLICEDELLGIVMLAKKEEGGAYRVSDLSFLQAISTICAIALKNACMYEKALNEARQDELTGLISRKYFYELLDQEFDRNRGGSLALSVINVDDFRLYNQLYGTHEGDLALQRIAAIMKASVEQSCYAARINGKEFALILPGYDIYSAKVLTETIAAQIGEINSQRNSHVRSRLTVSAGICAAPYMAASAKELLKNADSAVYSVKRAGKNAVLMYSEEVYRKEMEQQSQHKSGYSEHASTIYALTAAIDTKDHYTFQHSQNVAYYASELAKAAGLEHYLVEIAKEAGLLHDIGKIGIREDILNKTGRLTPEEYEIMKSHVDNGVNIIRYLPSLDYVIPAVLSHHERYDGRGYPRKLAGEEIPLAGRILAVTDAFDAMISRRSYREPLSVERALSVLREECGKQFDPNLAALFVEMVENGRIEPQIQKSVTLEKLGMPPVVVPDRPVSAAAAVPAVVPVGVPVEGTPGPGDAPAF